MAVVPLDASLLLLEVLPFGLPHAVHTPLRTEPSTPVALRCLCALDNCSMLNHCTRRTKRFDFPAVRRSFVRAHFPVRGSGLTLETLEPGRTQLLHMEATILRPGIRALVAVAFTDVHSTEAVPSLLERGHPRDTATIGSRQFNPLTILVAAARTYTEYHEYRPRFRSMDPGYTRCTVPTHLPG